MHPIFAAVWKQGDKWRRKVGPIPPLLMASGQEILPPFFVSLWFSPDAQWVQRSVLMQYGILSYFKIGDVAPRGQMVFTQDTTVAQAVGNGGSSMACLKHLPSTTCPLLPLPIHRLGLPAR